jgi:hypothetical protein
MAGALSKIARLVRYPKLLDAALPRLPRPLRKALRTFHFKREIKRAVRRTPPVVLVYTAPKVASTAVTAALQTIKGQAVYQVHLISAESMRRLREGMRRRGLSMRNHDRVGLEDLGHAIAEEIIKPRHRARIVSLVRDPVARNISYYFQNLDVFWKTERAHERIEVGRLLAEFQERISHEQGIDWFDKEFKPVLGIDVYEHPFPHDVGFQRIDSKPYEVLIMRHDLDDRVKEKCLADLVGVPAVSLAPRNVGAQKVYSDAYREFLSRIELPEDYVKRMLDSKYARHFFSPDELARLRAKWRGTRDAGRLEYV